MSEPTVSPPGDRQSPEYRRVQHVRATIEDLRRQIDNIPKEVVTGARRESITREEAGETARRARDVIERDEGPVHQSLRHRTVARHTKILALVFLVLIDLPVMLWLVSSVFNVDWFDPIGLPLVISVVVSILATAGAASVLYHMGHNRRQYKNRRRELEWAHVPLSGRVSLMAVGLLIALISIVMFMRVFTEGALSGLSGLAIFLSILVALVMLLSAALVFFTAFRDGSPEQEDWEDYSALYAEGDKKKRELEVEVSRLQKELGQSDQGGSAADVADRSPSANAENDPVKRGSSPDGAGAKVLGMNDHRPEHDESQRSQSPSRHPHGAGVEPGLGDHSGP